MAKLKKGLVFETAFGLYTVDEIIGEGGAGRVFGGTDTEKNTIALKVLSEEHASTDKRRRFKNEIAFLARTKHPNVVPVVDYGISRGQDVNGPFYVMPRYDGSLRDIMHSRIPPEQVLPLFSQMLDGVEAAHLQKVIHRDLKPENVLHDRKAGRLAIADFGIAQFSEELAATAVETAPSQRLANFQYAAPEQRVAGKAVSIQTDIYALGLILNEMFTGIVPHGTQHKKVKDAEQQFAFLDPLIDRMLTQSPAERPASISEIKTSIQRYHAEAVALQKLSKLDGTVIRSEEIDEPLAAEPPVLVGADWERGRLTLMLDRPVNQKWIEALHNMGSFSAVMGKPPQMFSFNGKIATVVADDYQVQNIIDHFKNWLPFATRALKQRLEAERQKRISQQQEQLRRERLEEETRLRVLKNIRI